jgi:hypothetical protein
MMAISYSVMETAINMICMFIGAGYAEVMIRKKRRVDTICLLPFLFVPHYEWCLAVLFADSDASLRNVKDFLSPAIKRSRTTKHEEGDRV